VAMAQAQILQRFETMQEEAKQTRE
jgi:hypothetical protein